MDFGNGFDDSLPFDESQFAPPGFHQFGTTFDYDPQCPWNASQLLAFQCDLDSPTYMHQLPLGRTNSLPDAQADPSPLLQVSTEHQADKQDTTLKQYTEDDRRPHKCTIQGCRVRGFKNSIDLRRHQGVHGNPRFFCPVTTCKAHTKGFKRKDNLTEHKKRVHGTNSHSPVITLRTTKQGSRAASCEDEEMEDLSLAPTPVEMENGSNVNLPAKAFLLAKLAELRTSREKMNGEIRAVEMTLSLM
ncbi:hypothetical protein OCU04_006769 [Sclerotinia nivalis]|uniref:C2H2-type domain-containing protein n=1 Tax=Sclerotinia nivalis TaxID=352851 RepID=A0A9X0AKE8_9HELO|nr:hypothetical protein OCU04_006769 [Sclerotinia nivalis]